MSERSWNSIIKEKFEILFDISTTLLVASVMHPIGLCMWVMAIAMILDHFFGQGAKAP